MKRLQKQFLTAAVVVVAGGGAGLYTLYEKVKTPEARLLEHRESQRLFQFGWVDVEEGQLRSPTATISFALTEAGWRLTKPLEWPGNAEAFESLLNSMAGLIIDRKLTESADLTQLVQEGLDRPAVTLSVKLKDGRTLTLHVGRKNKLLDRYPVTDADKQRIGLVEPSGYWNYTRSVDEFRSKQVFATSDDDIRQVEIVSGNGEQQYSLVVEDEGWRLDRPGAPSTKADDKIVNLFLQRITTDFDADDYLTDAYSDSDGSKYGLAPPTLRMRLHTADGKLGAAIGFVTPEGAEDPTAYILLDGTRTLLRNTDPTLRDDLTKPARTFVDRTLCRFDPKQAHRVSFQVAGRPAYRAERDGDGWRLLEPKSQPAKTWKLDGIVRLLSRIRATAWHADQATAEELKEWRLIPAARRVTVEDAEGKVLADIKLGKYADDNRLFIRASGSKRIGIIAETVVRVVPERGDELVE